MKKKIKASAADKCKYKQKDNTQATAQSGRLSST